MLNADELIFDANHFAEQLNDSLLRTRPEELKKIMDRLADWLIKLPSPVELSRMSFDEQQKIELQKNLTLIIQKYRTLHTALFLEQYKIENFLDFFSHSEVLQPKTYGPDGKSSYSS